MMRFINYSIALLFVGTLATLWINQPVEEYVEPEEYADIQLGSISDIKNNLGTSLSSVWELKDGALTTDSHGSNTLTNSGVTFSDLIQSGGGEFELDENDYMSIASTANLEPTSSTDYSFCFWFKPESLSGVRGLISKEGSGTGYLVYTNSTSVYFIHQGVDQTAGTTLSVGTTYHLCAVWDGSNTQTLKLYVSSGGTADASPAASPSSRSYNTSTATLKIGERTDGSGNSDGVIAQVIFWDGIILSDTNVADLYNGGTGVPYDAGGGGSTYINSSKVIMFD